MGAPSLRVVTAVATFMSHCGRAGQSAGAPRCLPQGGRSLAEGISALDDVPENAVPQLGPRGESLVDGLLALRPLGVVVAAQVDEHLHSHGSVFFAVNLDVAPEIINKG